MLRKSYGYWLNLLYSHLLIDTNLAIYILFFRISINLLLLRFLINFWFILFFRGFFVLRSYLYLHISFRLSTLVLLLVYLCIDILLYIYLRNILFLLFRSSISWIWIVVCKCLSSFDNSWRNDKWWILFHYLLNKILLHFDCTLVNILFRFLITDPGLL